MGEDERAGRRDAGDEAIEATSGGEREPEELGTVARLLDARGSYLLRKVRALASCNEALLTVYILFGIGGSNTEMWTIQEHRSVAKVLARSSEQVGKKYEFWKNVVRHSGPEGLRSIKGFHDEALKGDLAGSRSSRISDGYRVIYKVVRGELTVNVERITNHVY